MVYLDFDVSSLQNLRVWGFGVVVLQGTQRFLFPTGWSPLLHCYVDLLKGLVSVTLQFSSVPQSCLTVSDPMDWSTPGLLVHHQLPELLKLMSLESVMPSNHLIPVVPFSSRLESFPASGSFPMSQFFASGGQSIGASASASVLPMNIQGWFPLRLTDLISLQSKGL